MLGSINDRLAGLSGQEFDPLGDAWILDCYQAVGDESDALDEEMEAIKSKRR